MIVWIDGTYGVGKTLVVSEMRKKLPKDQFLFMNSDFYEGEIFREMIREKPDWFPGGGILPQNNKNFIKRFKKIVEEQSNSANIIVEMALTQKECKEDLYDCLIGANKNILHIILVANEETIKSRIDHDDSREDKATALHYLHSNVQFLNENFLDATRINTDNRSASDIASEIVAIIQSRLIE